MKRLLAKVVVMSAFLGATSISADDFIKVIHYNDNLYGPDRRLTEVLKELPIELQNGEIPNLRIVVHKKDYSLVLMSKDLFLKSYRIRLGPNPEGPKIKQGDGRTPEGEYSICHKGSSTYYKALWINYPNEKDIDLALNNGRITQKQASGLRGAIRKGDCPSTNSALGGEILIHGQSPGLTKDLAEGVSGKELREGLIPGDVDPWKLTESANWTLGCIALSNPDIRELMEYVPVGTRVNILGDDT